MSGPAPYHVLIKGGDAEAEVRDAIRAIGSAPAAGVHRYFYVTRADQTVVMTTDAAAPIVGRLRAGEGWSEPGADPERSDYSG